MTHEAALIAGTGLQFAGVAIGFADLPMAGSAGNSGLT